MILFPIVNHLNGLMVVLSGSGTTIGTYIDYRQKNIEKYHFKNDMGN